MDEYLVIPCSLNCSGQFRYPVDATPTDGIVALYGTWRGTTNTKLPAMSTPPKYGRHYFVTFSGPLTLHLGTDFWIVYHEPAASYNGFEIEHIDGARFCRCKTIRRVGTHGLKVRVREVRGIASALEMHECQLLPEWRRTQLNDRSYMNNISSNQDYELLQWNSQGDVGGHYIIRKVGDARRLVSFNEWDFHCNAFHLVNIPLETPTSE